MYFLIQNAPIRWPDYKKHGIAVSDDAKDLITKMLEKDRKVRLGQENGVEDILGHPWFKDIEIPKLIAKEIKAPHIPKVRSENELRKESPKAAVEESIVPQEKKELIANKDEVF